MKRIAKHNFSTILIFKFITSSLFIMFFSCSGIKSYKKMNINGIYESTNKDVANYFIFNSNGTFIYKRKLSPHPTRRTDTITFGFWKYSKDGYLIIDNSNILNNQINLSVKEEQGKNNDSIYIYFTSPIEKEFTSDKRLVYYDLLEISSDSILSDNYPERVFSNIKNFISFKKYGHEKITYLLVGYHTSCITNDYIAKCKDRLFYIVQNKKANVFHININNLNLKFLTYTRLYDDFIKINNNNLLLWNGIKYKRIMK